MNVVQKKKRDWKNIIGIFLFLTLIVSIIFIIICANGGDALFDTMIDHVIDTISALVISIIGFYNLKKNHCKEPRP